MLCVDVIDFVSMIQLILYGVVAAHCGHWGHRGDRGRLHCAHCPHDGHCRVAVDVFGVGDVDDGVVFGGGEDGFGAWCSDAGWDGVLHQHWPPIAGCRSDIVVEQIDDVSSIC